VTDCIGWLPQVITQIIRLITMKYYLV
jgi:hypothetical protein